MAHYDDIREESKEDPVAAKRKVVEAWLQNKTIQFFFDGVWNDWDCSRHTHISPMTHVSQGWRVKPEAPWKEASTKVPVYQQASYIQGWKDAEKYHGKGR